MSDLKNKRIITAAVTGAWPTRQDNPALPVTPEEIAEDVYECWKAGAAVAHIHVRNDDGTPCTDFERYKETIDLIRAKKDCDICINITSSGGTLGSGSTEEDDEARIKPIRELLPEICSYDCGTMNWQNRTILENHPRFLETLGKEAQRLDIKPEIEIFDAGMIYTAEHYVKTGILKAPCHFQLILGAAGGVKATVEDLIMLKGRIPEGSTWAAAGIGRGHVPIMMATIAMGGHLRVGLEDNVYYSKGVLAENNAQLVSRAKRLIEEAGYETATPEEARKILGLVRKVQ
ncbi:3-keto-5-aminohexanoate cleavage protein [Frisingicoccus sp.]|uniref:3-keto-5-aminohexanoate cleavage protein n=1 Tax=Frisingicoccus sp. TaxID=1918627 RepID=UPI003AB7BCD3